MVITNLTLVSIVNVNCCAIMIVSVVCDMMMIDVGVG